MDTQDISFDIWDLGLYLNLFKDNNKHLRARDSVWSLFNSAAICHSAAL